MSAMSLALLLTTATATAVGVAALHAAHVLRRQVSALRRELAADRPGGFSASVPQARSAMHPTQTQAIRTAVAEALAEERERELAEARAFWAAQEARDAADAPSMLGGLAGLGTEEAPFYVPRQADFAGLEAMRLDGADVTGETDALESLEALDDFTDFTDFADYPELTEVSEVSGAVEAAEFAEDSPELAAARRRHPSHPDFVPVRTPVVTDHERTVARLEELAETRTALADVRPGPLGTLDVYVFADGTTLCMTPGHRETAERLADALRAGETPFLLGGSGVSGAYALTFACGDDATGGGGESADGAEHVYILADRVIASL
ncbi:hypothetical protein DVH02_12035 [Streptomyces corynorhini]|uniref:Secreted protein n=2 Tax=Streptomyces corynorhini TaxID=2282652 RepID=A0A370B8F9_9ACTN|nr:hypothetical protein DVH02_12035 [Streptomyces corynorhini]